jgi:methyl-accepting chemotaxis protein
MHMATPKRFAPTIFQKILAAMLFVALVPLCVIWYIDYTNAISQTTRSINQQLAEVADKLTGTVNAWITLHQKLLNQNASLADVRSMETTRQVPVLQSILRGYEWSFLVHTTGPNGINVARSDEKPPIDYSDRVYFKQVMGGAPLGQQAVISRTTGKPSLLLAAPIYGPGATATDKGPIIGAIAIGVSIDELSERITNLRVGQTGFAFLLDENGEVIAHQKQEYSSKLANFSKHPAFVGKPAQGTAQLHYDDSGVPVIAFASRTKNGWTLVVQQNYDEAFSAVQEANRNAILLLAATLIAVIVIAYLFSQGIARPIRNLTKAADEMSRGRTDIKIVEVGRADEIGALAAAIERMGTSIRLAIERLRVQSAPARPPRADAPRQ